MAKKARAVETVDEGYDRPHRAKPSGLAGSAARLTYYWLDYMGGYFRRVRPVLKRREVMLFDRYFYDMIADGFRSRIALPLPLLLAMGQILPLQFAFFIRVDAQEIHRRKQELTMAEIVALNDRYGELVRRGWLNAVENNGAPEDAAAAIVDRIVADRHARRRGAAMITSPPAERPFGQPDGAASHSRRARCARCRVALRRLAGAGVLEEADVPTRRYWYRRNRLRIVTLFTYFASQVALYWALVRSRDIPRDATVFVNTLLPLRQCSGGGGLGGRWWCMSMRSRSHPVRCAAF